LFLRKPISGTRPKFRTKRKPPVSEVYFWLDKPERNRSILDSTRATRWLRSKLNQGAVDDQGDPSTCLLLGINRGSLFLLNLGVALIATAGHGLASPHADTTTSGVRAVDVSKLLQPMHWTVLGPARRPDGTARAPLRRGSALFCDSRCRFQVTKFLQYPHSPGRQPSNCNRRRNRQNLVQMIGQ
jgi:hypothetical protein